MNAAGFWLLATVFTVYAALDGYDLGVGTVHLWLARNNAERRINLNAIGPVWNGNEVWLIAGGGLTVAMFPRLYAAAFSGFYLALMVVLWLLVLRGVAIEFRGQIGHELWAAFWDATFWIASLLLTLALGVALGNVVRGLPVGPGGYFPGSFTMMLNPYAMLIGLLSLALLTWHGLCFMRTKAEGAQLRRARAWSRAAWWVAMGIALAATVATDRLAPAMLANFWRHPAWVVLPALSVAGFALGWSGSDRRAFAGSVLVIVGLLGSAAATIFPNLLRSTLNPAFSLNIHNAAAGTHGLRMALIGNGIALAAVACYSIYVHGVFRGKVNLRDHSY